MLPLIIDRFGLCRPSRVMDETDLPDPDSPTMASVCPSLAS